MTLPSARVTLPIDGVTLPIDRVTLPSDRVTVGVTLRRYTAGRRRGVVGPMRARARR